MNRIVPASAHAAARTAAKAALAIAASVGLSLGLAAPAAAQTSVSINVGQPGFYGQLNIGGFPPPLLYSSRPVLVERHAYGAPIYLRVPEGHRRHWGRFCHRYNACGRQVYFVQDSWYNQTYIPHYRQSHYRGRPLAGPDYYYREGRREQRHEQRREERHERYREQRHDEHRGHGNEHRGHGNDRGGHDNGRGHGRHGD